MYEQARYELEVKVATSIKVAYGPVEVSAAAEYGAVEYLLVAGRAGKKLAAMVRSAGGTVFEVDEQHSPAEHTFLNTFTGLVALLRFAVPEDAACMLAAEAEAEAEADAANFRRTRTSTRAKTQARAFTTTAKAERAEEDEDEESHFSLLSAVMKASGLAPTASTTTSTSAPAPAEEEDDGGVEDEIEALGAIYPQTEPVEEVIGTEFVRVGTSRTCLIAAHIAGTASAVCLRVVLPAQYPLAAAEVVLEAHRAIGGGAAAAAIAAAAQAFCSAEAGDPTLFGLAGHLEEAVEDAADAAASSAAQA